MDYGYNGSAMVPKKSERKFSDGERDSIWTSWYDNGNKKFQATYATGRLNGSWTSWYQNGIIKEKNWRLPRKQVK